MLKKMFAFVVIIFALPFSGGAQVTSAREVVQVVRSETDISGVILRDVIAAASGGTHVCVLTSAGGVKCWGSNNLGQVGNGSYEFQAFPMNVIGLENDVKMISAGYEDTCALLVSGGVKCWGHYSLSNLPVNVPSLESGIVAVSVGGYFSCALTTTGEVKCWYGYDAPVSVPGLESGVKAISVGMNHACAITSSGGMKCWGENSSGQLGGGSQGWNDIPADVVGLDSGVSAITAGVYHSCAFANGVVKCWGDNNYGQLGDGSSIGPRSPIDVVGVSGNVSALSAGASHSCALMQSGEIRCWGMNHQGRLGNGSASSYSPQLPGNVYDITNAIALSSGYDFNCAVVGGGSVKCWGNNSSGQLSDGMRTHVSTPVDVRGLEGDVTDVAAGYFSTCALLSDGSVKCWGGNSHSQLGNLTTENRSLPTDVIGLSVPTTALAAGYSHVCALGNDTKVRCWGENSSGQLGDGTSYERSTPVEVIGLDNVKDIAAGDRHTCALTSTGGVKCWGSDQYGILGNGSAPAGLTPVDVVDLPSGVVKLVVGGSHTCVLTTLGSVKCWGLNYEGQLGDATNSDRDTPTDVYGLSSGIIALAAGSHYTCALTNTNVVKCWGQSVGTIYSNNQPEDVWGVSGNIRSLAAGSYHICALSNDGGVQCWGTGRYGELGSGSFNTSTIPLASIGLSAGVKKITPGGTHTCVILNSGLLKCFGWDGLGQLGQGTVSQRLLPTDVVERIPQGTLNYVSGGPGSYFTLTGLNYPPNQEVSFSVNGIPLTDTLTTTSSGAFVLHIKVQDVGGYVITDSVNPDNRAFIIVKENAPLRTQEGGAIVVELLSVHAADVYECYLSLIVR